MCLIQRLIIAMHHQSSLITARDSRAINFVPARIDARLCYYDGTGLILMKIKIKRHRDVAHSLQRYTSGRYFAIFYATRPARMRGAIPDEAESLPSIDYAGMLRYSQTPISSIIFDDAR